MQDSNLAGMQKSIDSVQTPSINDRLLDVVIATVPAILAYFVGWAYLHFYLSAFGFDESELDLGIPTIFVYAFPPIRLLFNSCWDWFLINWHWVLIISIGGLAMVWAIKRLMTPSMARTHNWLSRTRAKLIPRSPLGQGIGMLLTLVMLFFLAAPFIRMAALQQADQKWVGEGVRLDAVLKEFDAKERPAAVVNYNLCSKRRALDLVFADRSAYYMLCISSKDPSSAVVFEVRREGGLASVRYVSRPRGLGGPP